MKTFSPLVSGILLAATATESGGINLADKPAPKDKDGLIDVFPNGEPISGVDPVKNAADVLKAARGLATLYNVDKRMLANVGAICLDTTAKGDYANDEDAIEEAIADMARNMRQTARFFLALRSSPAVHANFKDKSLSARAVADSFAQTGVSNLRAINAALK